MDPIQFGEPTPTPLQWPLGQRARVLSAPASFAYVLDFDDDLAQGLGARAREQVHRLATARTLQAEVGGYELAPWFDAVRHGPGLLILNGVLATETTVAGRTIAELMGPGDLLQGAARGLDEMLDRSVIWRALSPCTLALLDSEFSERLRPWPQITRALLDRAGRRIASLGTLRAICCQPRLDVRLILVLWHFASRWGRVEPAGIRLTLPLTHRLLGELIAAERPSISHALQRLARAGLVSGTAGDLHLCGNVESHLEALAERAPLPRESSPGRRPMSL